MMADRRMHGPGPGAERSTTPTPPRMARPTIRLMVCGNADRSDDGLALAATATLLPTLPHDVLAALEVRRCMELRVEDLLDLPIGSSLVVVDAVTGVEPGQIVHLTLDELTAMARRGGPGRPMPRSSHQLPIELVLGLSELLRGRPIPGAFIGLGGRSFAFGPRLSRVVRDALPSLRAAISAELGRLTLAPTTVPPAPEH
jgi:hydrogenase maturation protease